MSPEKRKIAAVVATLAVVACVVGAGYLIVHARSGTGGGLQSPATGLPSSTPTNQASPTTASAANAWLVAKALGTVVVHRQPSPSAPVRATLAKVNPRGYATLMLVRETRRVDGVMWYLVSLTKRPSGSSGWVQASSVGTYTTVAKIVIDVSARRLSVFHNGRLMGRFPVAVGSSAYPTPTGSFFIDEKFRPSPSGGPFGVLAMGLNAFQPKLPALGSLAIHGTNNDAYIGQAVSDGCIRMRNTDVLKVSAWVAAGSPVVIEP